MICAACNKQIEEPIQYIGSVVRFEEGIEELQYEVRCHGKVEQFGINPRGPDSQYSQPRFVGPEK